MNIVTDNIRVEYFDQLKEILQGWETEPVQLSAGRLDLVVNTFSTADLSILSLRLGPKVADRSVVHEGTIGFVLVERPMVWCGIEIDPPALKIMRAGREMRSVLEPGCRTLEFYFREDDLKGHLLGRQLSRVDLTPERSVIPVSAQEVSALRAGAKLLAGADLPTPGGRDGEALALRAVHDRLLDNLDTLVARHLSGTRSGHGGNRRLGTLQARRALSLIEAMGVEHVSLGDLYDQLGVSRRAVEMAFRDYMGVSPAQYLLARRLTAVRDKLLGRGGPVYQRALDAGFRVSNRGSVNPPALAGS